MGRITASPGATLLLLALALGIFAGYVAVTGGFDTRIGSVPIRSRSWERPATISAVAASAALILLRRRVLAGLVRARPYAWAALGAIGKRSTLLAAAAVLIAALAFGTHIAGGADSYGYASQAKLLASGRLTDSLPPLRGFTWPDVPYTLAPLGYKPGTSRRTLAPTYPPGLPLLMAPLAAVHPDAVFLVVPLCAAAAVLLCVRLGRKLGEPVGGTLGAFLLAASPTFLHQAMQPMSDVPVTTFWLAALVTARSDALWRVAVSGVLASVAILIRPNLAPLAVFTVAAAAIVPGSLDMRRAITCAIWMLPGLFVLGAIQYVRYGSPLASGYGALSDLFAWSNVAPNLARYPRWLTEMHTPLIWLWLLGPVWIAGANPQVRAFGWICYLFVFGVFLSYLPYSYFRPEEWFYTRFLLPAVPMILVLGTLVTMNALRQIVPRLATGATIVLALAFATTLAIRAVGAGAFDLRGGEEKYPAVGEFVRERLPESAFIMAMQHSGSIRYYAGRNTLRWDLLDRASLGRALTDLTSAGYTPFAILDSDEDVEFRKRFGVASADALDRMTPIGSIGGTQVYAFR